VEEHKRTGKRTRKERDAEKEKERGEAVTWVVTALALSSPFLSHSLSN